MSSDQQREQDQDDQLKQAMQLVADLQVRVGQLETVLTSFQTCSVCYTVFQNPVKRYLGKYPLCGECRACQDTTMVGPSCESEPECNLADMTHIRFQASGFEDGELTMHQLTVPIKDLPQDLVQACMGGTCSLHLSLKQLQETYTGDVEENVGCCLNVEIDP